MMVFSHSQTNCIYLENWLIWSQIPWTFLKQLNDASSQIFASNFRNKALNKCPFIAMKHKVSSNVNKYHAVIQCSNYSGVLFADFYRQINKLISNNIWSNDVLRAKSICRIPWKIFSFPVSEPICRASDLFYRYPILLSAFPRHGCRARNSRDSSFCAASM